MPSLSERTIQDERTEKEASSESANLDSENLLWLVVKYKSNPSVWTFPFTHRRDADSAFETLTRLSREHIGMKPHLPGLAPIAFRKLDSESGPASRVFYYKAVHVPGTPEIRVPLQSEVVEHKWITRTRLREIITPATWLTLRESIPLD